MARALSLGVGPAAVALDSGDGVRVTSHPVLEQLVHPAVGQRVRGPGQGGQLVVTFTVREQVLPPVRGSYVGDQQTQRSEVVPGQPRRGRRVQGLAAVAQPQHRRAGGGRYADLEDDALRQFGVGVGVGVPRLGAGGECRLVLPGRAERGAQGRDVDVGVGQQVGLGAVHPAQYLAPGLVGRAEPAGQAGGRAGHQVPGGHLPLAGQGREHDRVRGQEHRGRRHPEVGRQLRRGREDVVRERLVVLAYPGGGVARPAGDRGETAGEEHALPVLLAGPAVPVHRGLPSVGRVVEVQLGDRSRTADASSAGRPSVSSPAGLPPQEAPSGISSPFIRNESGARTAPSPIVVP